MFGGVLFLLTTAHMLLPDSLPVLVVLHATSPYWSLLAVLGLLVVAASRAHRFVIYLYAALSFLHVMAYWLPVMIGGQRSPGTPAARIVSANLYIANETPSDLARELGALDADVLVLQEVDDRWSKVLAESSWYADYPHRHGVVRGDAFGIQILSRLPLRSPEILTVADIPALAATLTVDDREVRLLGVHLAPPVSGAAAEVQARQVRGLRSWIELPGEPPVVLVGDLNLTPWNPLYREIGAAPLTDVHVRLGSLPPLTWRPRSIIPSLDMAVLPLDHALVGQRVRVHGQQVGTGRGSDHRPVILDVSW